MVVSRDHTKSQCHSIVLPGLEQSSESNRAVTFYPLQLVEPFGIFNQNLMLVLFGNSFKAPFEPLVRGRPNRGRMREVRFPQDPVDADVVTKFNPGLLVPEIHVALDRKSTRLNSSH